MLRSTAAFKRQTNELKLLHIAQHLLTLLKVSCTRVHPHIVLIKSLALLLILLGMFVCAIPSLITD